MKQCAHPPTKTVYRLFYIADEKEASPFVDPDTGADLFDQRTENIKLNDAGVLKLVEQEVFQTRIEPEIEKFALQLLP